MHDSLAFHMGVEVGAEIRPRLEKLEEGQIGTSHDVVRRVITLLGVSAKKPEVIAIRANARRVVSGTPASRTRSI